jgi:hypothetical protein
MSLAESAAVRDFLSRISAAWQERRYDDLEQLFAPDMVFALPGFAGRLEGRTSVVASYREFMDRVSLTSYREEGLDIDVWGDTAVAKYRWEMAWVAGGVSNHEAGHDVFVLRRAGATGRPFGGR